MLAYCTALNVPAAWLVYAARDGRPEPRCITNTQDTVVEYPLDLRAHPSKLLAQIDTLADRAWSAIGVDQPRLVEQLRAHTSMPHHGLESRRASTFAAH